MIKLEAFKGMDNRHRAESLPEGFLRDLINVDIDDTGKISLRDGDTSLYSGDVHSYYKGYFVEGGDLKFLNSDNTATTVESSVGDTTMTYTEVGDTTYYSNGVITGKAKGTITSQWGVLRPPVQPVAVGTTTGDMFAGDYLIATTWVDGEEEGGSIISDSVTVAEGGGIQLDKFVTPPANVDKIAVYISEANSETLYLYGEYSRDLGSLSITKDISDIPMQTQFTDVPKPSTVIQSHYGRIYMARGDFVYFTRNQRYGLVDPNNNWRFDSEVQIIISVPNALYVVTKDKTYIITNIDGEGQPIRTEVKPYGGTKGSLSYDETTKNALWMSDRGLVIASSEGIQELHYNNVATSQFAKGATTIIEKDGIKKIVGSFQTGSASDLLDPTYKANEIIRKGNAI